MRLREQNPKWIDRGLAACDRAKALAPDLPEVLVAQARMFYAQKKYDEAALLAQRAIERKPDCEGAWNMLGRAYFASGRFEEAAALTERAIEANGDDYNTYIPYVKLSGTAGPRKRKRCTSGPRMTQRLRQQLELVPEDVRARILLAGKLATSKETRRRASGNCRLPSPCAPTMAIRSTMPRARMECWGKRRRLWRH